MKYIGTKRLETERLILRKMKLEDAEAAYNNWCSHDKVCKYTLWNKHKNVEETKELYKMWVKDYDNLDTYRWIVELKDTHEVIGTIDVVSKKYLKFGSCEIGYCYGDKYWNNGYATEALKAVIKFLFEEADAEVIYAEHSTLNPGSGKVMQKSGMKFEGVQRSRIVDNDNIRNDLASYSITKEEYFNEH
ncbi:MAG: GNAT family N-acetyltransferase [Bacilli bacterium]|nr:GNAT family N-acetyltransferase [Bacilli bacterium]MBQ6282927.1 GNAT family N-acetyltransferase [Bacilli bacterium]